MESNAYYIKVVMGDPYNDCKPIITDYMFEEANSSVDEIYCIINDIKKATSTKEKLDLLRALKRVEISSLSVVMETLYEEYLSPTQDNY